jgi:hypothetical protein
MKRVLVAFVLGLFLVSAAVGCGGGSPTPSKSSSPKS